MKCEKHGVKLGLSANRVGRSLDCFMCEHEADPMVFRRITDSYEMQSTGPLNLDTQYVPAQKFDSDKPRYDLIPPEMLDGAARVLTYGAKKYAARNWEKGLSWGRCFGALMRHLWAWWQGEGKDPETGFSHLDHALCCVAFLQAYERRGDGEDDRPKNNSEKTTISS